MAEHETQGGGMTPEDVIRKVGGYDPQALGPNEAAQHAGHAHGKGGPPPEDDPEQTRRADKASESNPESRDDHMTRIGRGHQTHG
jgi:hypothetical protein